MTVLAWGGISYEAGYRSAGEFEYLLDAVKWGTDYFIKCHVSDNEFYGQVEFETLKNDHYNLDMNTMKSIYTNVSHFTISNRSDKAVQIIASGEGQKT